jgi:hypothetical protein
MRRLVPLCLLMALAATLAFAGRANADYGKAQYQITFSSNCNNPAYCRDENGNPQLGGDWGWAALNADGTGDLVVTGCGHLPGFGGGAFNEHVDIYQWEIKDGVFFIDSASDPSFDGPSPIPYQPGHSYHFSFRPAPGVNVEGQVTQITS